MDSERATDLAADDVTSWWRHLPAAVGAAIALYTAPFAFFVTASIRTDPTSDPIVSAFGMWLGIALFYPGTVISALLTIAAIVLLVSSSKRAVRLRNVVIVSAIATVCAAFLAFGALDPSAADLL